MLQQRNCLVAACDDCGRFYDEDGEGVFHFVDTDDAYSVIRSDNDADYRWTVLPDFRLRCHACARTRYCAQHGHDYTPWHVRPAGYALREDVLVEQTAWVRFCRHCHASERTTEDTPTSENEASVGGGLR